MPATSSPAVSSTKRKSSSHPYSNSKIQSRIQRGRPSAPRPLHTSTQDMSHAQPSGGGKGKAKAKEKEKDKVKKAGTGLSLQWLSMSTSVI